MNEDRIKLLEEIAYCAGDLIDTGYSLEECFNPLEMIVDGRIYYRLHILLNTLETGDIEINT